METKILRLLIVALGFLIVLVTALAILFAASLEDVKNSIRATNRDADIVAAIKSLKVINGVSIKGNDGQDGDDGEDGKDGKDSVSTVVIQQQSIPGPKGDKGDNAPATPVPEFDGHGNWRYKGDEIWLPLNQTEAAE